MATASSVPGFELTALTQTRNPDPKLSVVGRNLELHGPNAVYRSLQPVPRREFRHTRRRAGRDERPGLQGHRGREETDEIAQPVDHVPGVRSHHGLAVLLDHDTDILRLADLVAGHDPRAQAAEGVE